MSYFFNKKTSLLACISICSLSTALAASSVATGWYIDANIGPTKLHNRDYGAGTASSSGIGGNINVGYKFMPYLAAEIGYSRFPNTNIKDTNGVRIGRDKHYTYQIDGKGIIPVGTSGFEFFGKLGWSRIKSKITITDDTAAAAANLSESSPSAGGIFLGAGAQYAFMPEMLGTVQWTRAKGNKSTGDLDLFAVGIEYLFN